MAHASKVSSGYMRALHLAEISFSLKTLGRQETTLGAQDFLSKFRHEQNRVIDAQKKIRPPTWAIIVKSQNLTY